MFLYYVIVLTIKKILYKLKKIVYNYNTFNKWEFLTMKQFFLKAQGAYYIIRYYVDNSYVCKCTFLYYTRPQAIKRMRALTNNQNKNIEIVENYYK